MHFSTSGSLHRVLVLTVGLGAVALAFVTGTLAQSQNYGTSPSADGWPQPVWNQPPITDQNRRPAPRRDLTGMWGPADGVAAGYQVRGVQLKPNDGRPENQLPYTPYGLELYRSHKALEGVDAVLPAEGNDPLNKCEPLGFPRYNHYHLKQTQIFQDEAKVVILYHYDNRWRVIWTDGRKLPTLLEGGGVEIDGEYREPRVFGYSVGRWVDDQTFEVQTVGTLGEDRVWLDVAGRPISDQLRVTETFRRLDHDTLEWSETIEDPKMYTKPWETMRMRMRMHDPRTDIMEFYCSPTERENYNRMFGGAASAP